MTKRYGGLWEKIVSPENILSAYLKARKGHSGKKSVLKFGADLENNLEKIRISLVEKTFTTSAYTFKTVYEPKERLIYILPFSPDRIVQHALMNVMEPIWEPMLISDSHACIKGRGIHSGSRRTMEFVRRNPYVLKCDISKFYPSISHEILKSIIRRKIKDKSVLWLVDDIIDSFKGKFNVPIGNYCSQWFGNLYLNELDQFVKTELKCRDYVRYCDDFLLFGDKARLKEWSVRVEEFLDGALGLKFSKCNLYPVKNGVDFLGYRHFDNHIIMRKSTAKRMRKRLHLLPYLYRHEKIGFETFRSSVASITGWLMWAQTGRLQERLRLDKIEKMLNMLKRKHFKEL